MSHLKKHMTNIVIPMIHTLLKNKELQNDIVEVQKIVNELIEVLPGTFRSVNIIQLKLSTEQNWVRNFKAIELGERDTLDLNILVANDAYRQLINNKRTRNAFRDFYVPRLYENKGYMALKSAGVLVIKDWNDIPTHHVYINGDGKIVAAMSVYGQSLNNWAQITGLSESIFDKKSMATHFVKDLDTFFVTPSEVEKILSELETSNL